MYVCCIIIKPSSSNIITNDDENLIIGRKSVLGAELGLDGICWVESTFGVHLHQTDEDVLYGIEWYEIDSGVDHLN